MYNTYHKSFPSTLLTLVKALFGLASLALLFLETKLIFDLTRSVKAFDPALNTPLKIAQAYLTSLLQRITSPGTAGTAIVDALFGVRILAVLFLAALLITLILKPLLIALDGIGAILLRFSGRAGLTRFVHVIFGALSLFSHLTCIASVILTLLYRDQIFTDSGMAQSDIVVILIPFISLTLVRSLIPLMKFSYHKDIVQLAETASEDYYEGEEPDLIANHLSGLALGAFIVNLIGTLLCLFPTFAMTAAASDERTLMFIVTAVFALITLKYLLVMLLNNMVRKDFLEREIERCTMTLLERLLIIVPATAALVLMLIFGRTAVTGIGTFVASLEENNAVISEFSLSLPAADAGGSGLAGLLTFEAF